MKTSKELISEIRIWIRDHKVSKQGSGFYDLEYFVGFHDLDKYLKELSK